eukprot:CAMPEP_0170809594 /NCGR_PEP_ID=MMETSP0733-20121128/34129_1 /TAXON_ID=186038 /ORGANISM="Fragilariopsis kerguelensis, Strain L26-C5" /LENGTH=173 /DNA_ID=CAMNT_0011165337 /DNA_START=217 /DNA_END=740 /DNA_ORIENTATION=-
MNLSRQVQQFIYEDTGHLADGNPINQKIIDFMEYLPDNGGAPPPDNSISSSSSSNIDSIKTSKKNQKEISGIIDLLEVIASQGISGKGKAKQFLDCEDKMIMNSKHEHFADIPKDITLETMAEWRYKYTSVLQTSPWSIDGELAIQIHFKHLRGPLMERAFLTWRTLQIYRNI